MPKIPSGKVKITKVFLVDCGACCEAVEPDGLHTLGGGFTDIEKAREAKRNHLEEHERGEWG